MLTADVSKGFRLSRLDHLVAGDLAESAQLSFPRNAIQGHFPDIPLSEIQKVVTTYLHCSPGGGYYCGVKIRKGPIFCILEGDRDSERAKEMAVSLARQLRLPKPSTIFYDNVLTDPREALQKKKKIRATTNLDEGLYESNSCMLPIALCLKDPKSVDCWAELWIGPEQVCLYSGMGERLLLSDSPRATEFRSEWGSTNQFDSTQSVARLEFRFPRSPLFMLEYHFGRIHDWGGHEEYDDARVATRSASSCVESIRRILMA